MRSDIMLRITFVHRLTFLLLLATSAVHTATDGPPPPDTFYSVQLEVDEFPLWHVSILDQVGTESSSLVERILLIERHICGQDCSGKSYPHYAVPRRWIDCHQCHCDSVCSVYQDCCPDVLLQHNVTYNGQKLAHCFSITPFPVNERFARLGEHQTFFSDCPHVYIRLEDHITEDGLALQQGMLTLTSDMFECTNFDLRDKEKSIPVSSETTGFSYRNMACARCNNDTDTLHKWRVTLDCEETASKLMPRLRSKEDLYRILMTPQGVIETGCDLSYIVPTSADSYRYRRTCSRVQDPVISACNVSGNLTYYDKRLDEACAMYTSTFMERYKNMFCYICNLEHGIDLEILRKTVQWGYPANSARLSFSALLDFDEKVASSADRIMERAITPQNCLGQQFFDPFTCQCRTPECSEGKSLTDDGRCESLITSNILGYRVCGYLFIEAENDTDYDDLAAFRQPFQYHQGSGQMQHKDWMVDWCPGHKNMTVKFEDLFTMDGTLETIELAVNSTYRHLSLLIHRNLERNRLFRDHSFTFVNPDQCASQVNHTYPCQSDPLTMFFQNEIYYPVPMGMPEIYYIDYFSTNKCPFVNVLSSSFIPAEDEDSFLFLPTKKIIKKNQVDQVNETAVRVCVDDFIFLAEVDFQFCQRVNTDSFDTWTIPGLVSIVCTCISLLCLMMTFITYIILPPLRSKGGKNIMMLTLALFTAQAFYEFAIEQFENPTACKAFGITIHYTWLVAVFSMNACTVERFLKLCFPLKTRLLFLSSKPLILATLYTLTGPALIVASNIIVNHFTLGHIGYGSSSVCYINNSVSRIVAFAVPIGVLVVVNICLLLITIWSLKRTTTTSMDTKSTAQNKVGLVACVRLSTVTGLTWILAFAYELFPNDVWGYVFTALMGLQGVVFFFSMIINKRVLQLYSQLWSSWRCESKSSSSGSARGPGHPYEKREEKGGKAASHSDHTQTTSAGSDNGVENGADKLDGTTEPQVEEEPNMLREVM